MIRTRLGILLAVCLAYVSGTCCLARGQSITSTTLAPLPAGTVATGIATQLVVSVRDSNGPVLAGQITFFDSARIIGQVPIVRTAAAGYIPGTATLAMVFGPGTHALHAVFGGTTSEQTSSSSSAYLNVASGAGSSSGLFYANTRYFGQLAGLEQFVLADVNNDGVLDLVATQFGFPNIAVSLGDPANPGAFLPPTFPALPSSSNDAVVVGDLNGDGLTDIVLSSTDDRSAVILFQDAAHPGTFLAAEPVGRSVERPQIADVNRDGIPDLILFPDSSYQGLNSSISVLLGDPLNPGSFLFPVVTALGDDDIRHVSVADMNGDGLPDIVLGNSFKQTIAILLNNPASPGSFLPRVDYPAGQNYGLAIADLNNDGFPDVVVGGTSSGVTVFLGSSAHPGQLLTAASYPVSQTGDGSVAIGDVDGDGIPDVVSGSDGPLFDLLLGNGDGSLKPPIAYTTGPTPATFGASSISIGDVDGDGVADVLIGQSHQNSVQVFLHQAASPQRVITATDLITGPSVDYFGNPISLTYQTSSSIGPPSGSLALYDSFGRASYTFLSTIPLDSTGTATYTVSAPSVGFHDYIVHFAGDTIYAPSTSLIQTVVVAVHPVAGVTLSAIPNPATPGQAVTFTATVTATGAPPTGSVVFLDGGATIGNAPIVAGNAIFTTSLLIAGTHTIQATYMGDSNYASQSASVTEIIHYPPVSETFTSSINPANVGQPVTFTAQVSATGPAPTGQVIIQDNGHPIAVVPVTGNGSETFTTSVLTAGSHTIAALYSGDANYSAQSASLTQSILAFPSSTTLIAAPNPAFAGQPVTMTAAIVGLSGSATGAALFYDGSTLLGSVPLDSSGHAAYISSALAPGVHSITAAYGGNASYAASASAAYLETILPSPSDFTLTLASPTLTLQTQHHLNTTINLTSLNGFADTLTLSCVNLPQYLTCRPAPSMQTLAAGSTTTVSLYLDTDSVVGFAGIHAHPPPSGRGSWPVTLAFLLATPYFFAQTRRRLTRRLFVSILALAALSLTLTGCGDIIFSAAIAPSVTPGTYAIPITATGATTGMTHTTQLTLTIIP